MLGLLKADFAFFKNISLIGSHFSHDALQLFDIGHARQRRLGAAVIGKRGGERFREVAPYVLHARVPVAPITQALRHGVRHAGNAHDRIFGKPVGGRAHFGIVPRLLLQHVASVLGQHAGYARQHLRRIGSIAALAAVELVVGLAGNNPRLLRAFPGSYAVQQIGVFMAEELPGWRDDEHHIAILEQRLGARATRSHGVVDAGRVDDLQALQSLVRNMQGDGFGKRHESAARAHEWLQFADQRLYAVCLDSGVFLHFMQSFARCLDAAMLVIGGKQRAVAHVAIGLFLGALFAFAHFFRGQACVQMIAAFSGLGALKVFTLVFLNQCLAFLFIGIVPLAYVLQIFFREEIQLGAHAFAILHDGERGGHGRGGLGQYVLPVKQQGVEHGTFASFHTANNADAQHAPFAGQFIQRFLPFGTSDYGIFFLQRQRIASQIVFLNKGFDFVVQFGDVHG